MLRNIANVINTYKYIKNIAEGEGTILLYDQIGDSVDASGNVKYGISGSSFAYEMQYLATQCSRINVRINSIGGSVIDGYSIISAIINSPVPVDTYIDGLAASISGVIAVSGKKCRMMDYGTLMMHSASGTNDKAMIDLVNGTLVTVLSNRTSKSPAEISAMMDKETWLTAEEALNMGIVDEVIASTKKIKVKKESLQNMALIYNKLINTDIKMTEVTNILKLKNEATEQEIVSAITSKDAEIEELKNNLETMKNKIAEFEAKELEAKEAAELALKEKATALINKAKEEKKITEAEAPDYIEQAIKNFSFVENSLSKIPTVKTATKVFDLKNVATKKGTEDRSTWTIRDWETKDVTGLAEMKNTSPDQYTELFNAFYKKQK